MPTYECQRLMPGAGCRLFFCRRSSVRRVAPLPPGKLREVLLDQFVNTDSLQLHSQNQHLVGTQRMILVGDGQNLLERSRSMGS